MAIVPHTVPIYPVSVGFNSPSSPDRANGAVPQSALVFYANDTFAGPGAGNSIRLDIELHTDASKWYILTDFSLGLTGNTGPNSWVGVFDLQVQTNFNTPVGSPVQHIACNSWATDSIVGGYGQFYTPERLPSYPFNGGVVGSIGNAPGYPSSTATVTCYARMLVFDAEQFHNWPLHTPAIIVG